MSNIKPTLTRVVIEREVMGEKIGSIVIPEKSRHGAQVGTVRAIGPDVTTVAIGDKVLFGKYTTSDVREYGLFIWEADIIAILEDK